MANIKSAAKRVLISKERNAINKANKSELKTSMKKFDAAVWAHHGLFCSGPDFDITFGLMHTIEKAAEIHNLVMATSGGNVRQTITDDNLRAIARDFGVTINEEFLD